MEIWLISAFGALALIAIISLCKLFSIRYSLREIARELDEKMSVDTNTLISISSADPAIRELAVQINGHLRDLRDERRRLQNGDAELKAAVTNISHDLRTPLTAISGYIDLLEREEESKRSQRYLAIIRERCEALKSLTEELFRYSVITSVTNDMRFEEISLNAALEQCLADIYVELTHRGITPEISLPDKPVMRLLDRAALYRIFNNILSNAVKYSDGDLSVALTCAGEIEFRNTARGLNLVGVERLFDRFYTVESARNSSGLGLSIAKMLTEKLAGEIAAEYKNETLIIRLSFPDKK
ncbi:MAG: HAMP domain-containing sensor histidine kinase [Clostridia bacterium]|nr:HAMP domain-containing sensor histidine kinase [Clostridia bacterium]